MCAYFVRATSRYCLRFSLSVLPMALWLLSPCRAGETDLTLPALAKQVRPAVFLVLVNDSRGVQVGSGSGFLISTDGKLVTNFHVVEQGASYQVKGSNGGVFKVERLLATDKTNDLALLKVECADMPTLNLGSTEGLEAGVKVAVIGSPLGLEGSLSEGIVSAIRNEPRRWIQMTAAISPGSSGSPVVNFRGEVIGVAAATLVDGQALNIAIPVEAVRKLQERRAAEVAEEKVPVAGGDGAATEKACNVCGGGRGTKTSANAYDTKRQFSNKWHGRWCEHCSAGRELVTECYHLLARIIEDAEKNPPQNSAAQLALENRKRALEERIKLLNDEIRRYEDTKSDVRDVKAKAETRLRDAQRDLQKVERDMNITARKDRPGYMANDHDYRYYYWWGYGVESLDELKKEMVTMGVEIPNKVERVPLPKFKIDSMDDLIVAARANLEARAKGKAAGAAARQNAGKVAEGRALPVYVLHDGRQIKAKIAMEEGNKVILTTEDNKMVTINKSDIKAIGRE